MKYKLLIIDIDGTLIGRKGTIAPVDRAAVGRALDSGLKVALSTGRVPQSCIKTINELGLDGCHIFFDGALVGPLTGQEIYSRPVPGERVKRLVEFTRLNDIYLELYTPTRYYIERDNFGTSLHREFFGIAPTRIDLNTIWDKEKVIKGELFVSSPAEELEAKTVEARFNDRLRFSWASTPAYPGVFFVNIVEPGVSKGTALLELNKYLGINVDETIAIGDGLNDIPLLRAAGTAVAMGNASAEVKGVADHITGDVDAGGLAAAINRILAGDM